MKYKSDDENEKYRNALAGMNDRRLHSEMEAKKKSLKELTDRLPRASIRDDSESKRRQISHEIGMIADEIRQRKGTKRGMDYQTRG